MPRPTCSWRITPGVSVPSISGTKDALIAGTAARACTTAQPIKWVKLTLPPVVRAEMVVEDEPVDLEELGRNGPKARGRRNGQAGAHVLHDAGCNPSQRDRRRRLDGGRRRGPTAPGRGSGRLGGPRRGR